MADNAGLVEHTASAVAAGVAKKAAILTAAGIIAAAAVQMTAWPGTPLWPVSAGVLVGALTLIYVATVLAALYPARVAMRLNPVEVIHEE